MVEKLKARTEEKSVSTEKRTHKPEVANPHFYWPSYPDDLQDKTLEKENLIRSISEETLPADDEIDSLFEKEFSNQEILASGGNLWSPVDVCDNATMEFLIVNKFDRN